MAERSRKRFGRVRVRGGKLPDLPGVYLMKNGRGRVLYVGKAGNLRRRVESYFSRPNLRHPSAQGFGSAQQGSGGQAHDFRIRKLVGATRRIDYEKTGTAIEALIREAELIKKLEPPFNVREKDDKSFLYVLITKEKFPRVLLVRGKDKPVGAVYGPFTAASSVRQALRILRRIFSWSDHPSPLPGGKGEGQAAKESKPCFNYQIGLCPGTCIGAADPAEYRKTIANLKLFFAGKKKRVIAALEREMKAASAALEFEKAEKSRRRLFALQHIQDVALIADDKFQIPNAKFRRPFRIEGYDISNIGGDHAVGSMAVFEGERPAKDEYRRFAIRTVIGSNDTAMFQEVLTRRFDHAEWKFPDLILVDGGVPQVNAVRRVLRERRLRIPVMGLAKGPERKRNDLIGIVPPGFSKETLIRLRDEAHRFAVAYHRRMRARRFTRPLS